MGKILQISKTLNPTNPFCFVFDYFLYQNDIDDKKYINQLKKVILKKEKIIVKKYPFTSDSGTGVGKHSLTGRTSEYNMLDWKESKKLKKYIRKAYDDFLKNLSVEPEKNIYVQCWANVLRKKEKLKHHSHSKLNDRYSYISGHISIHVDNTNTYYMDPITKNVMPHKNIEGRITLFPMWLPHYTDTIKTNLNRITIAFDIKTEKGWMEDIYDHKKSHWIKI